MSYLLKLSLAEAIGGDPQTPPIVREVGERFLTHFLCDNTSPETHSFHPVILSPGTGMGRAAALTKQLLAFSSRQIMEMRPLDLNGVIRNLQRMLGRLIGEEIEIQTHLAPDLGTVKADVVQIEQVILKLAINARDAMPMGGGS